VAPACAFGHGSRDRAVCTGGTAMSAGSWFTVGTRYSGSCGPVRLGDLPPGPCGRLCRYGQHFC
jgi:hypothetical protein